MGPLPSNRAECDHGSYNFPDLDGEDVFHLQQLEKLHGEERVIGWLRGKTAIPLRYQFQEGFDEDAYFEAMRERYVDTVINRLNKLGVGNEITVSERETSMTVTDISENAVGTGVTVRAKNHHGRYRLRQHGDESISFRAGGRLISGDVEVFR